MPNSVSLGKNVLRMMLIKSTKYLFCGHKKHEFLGINVSHCKNIMELLVRQKISYIGDIKATGKNCMVFTSYRV